MICRMSEAMRMQSMTGCGTDFKQIQQMTDISKCLHHDQSVSIRSVRCRIEDNFLHFIYAIEKTFYVAVIIVLQIIEEIHRFIGEFDTFDGKEIIFRHTGCFFSQF